MSGGAASGRASGSLSLAPQPVQIPVREEHEPAVGVAVAASPLVTAPTQRPAVGFGDATPLTHHHQAHYHKNVRIADICGVWFPAMTDTPPTDTRFDGSDAELVGDPIPIFVPLTWTTWAIPCFEAKVIAEVAWRRGVQPWTVVWQLLQPLTDLKKPPRTGKAFRAMLTTVAASVETVRDDGSDAARAHISALAVGRLREMIEESLEDESEILG